ncbi:MAG: hypothetical protein ABIJ58_03160 [Nanoarchaeota archaeon]|nr:hypothetical protein [Nanoarchaeota archaeon]
MEEGLTRYELGMIRKVQDQAHYTCVSPDSLAQQMQRVCLLSNDSRFNLAQRIKQIEGELDN